MNTTGLRSCSSCRLIKNLSDFHKDKKDKQGHAFYCKMCANSKTRAHHAQNKHDPEYLKRKSSAYYKRTYGLSFEERTSMLEAQKYKCAICDTGLSSTGGHTHTDHCHTTGKVRGILCTNCNRGIGHFQENPDIIRAAIEYLKSHTADGKQTEGRSQ